MFRLRTMDENRRNNKVFKWAHSQGSNRYKIGTCVLRSNIENVIFKLFSGMLKFNI